MDGLSLSARFACALIIVFANGQVRIAWAVPPSGETYQQRVSAVVPAWQGDDEQFATSLPD